jgi:NikR C terminal nickel binding domain
MPRFDLSILHAHLDHESCLEVVVLAAKSGDVQKRGGPPRQTIANTGRSCAAVLGFMQDLYQWETPTMLGMLRLLCKERYNGIMKGTWS